MNESSDLGKCWCRASPEPRGSAHTQGRVDTWGAPPSEGVGLREGMKPPPAELVPWPHSRPTRGRRAWFPLCCSDARRAGSPRLLFSARCVESWRLAPAHRRPEDSGAVPPTHGLVLAAWRAGKGRAGLWQEVPFCGRGRGAGGISRSGRGRERGGQRSRSGRGVPRPGGGRCGLGGQGAAFSRCARPAWVRARLRGDGAERGGPGKVSPASWAWSRRCCCRRRALCWPRTTA